MMDTFHIPQDDAGEPEELTEVEQAWVEEAERRYRDYLSGAVKGIPAADAIADIRARLKTLQSR